MDLADEESAALRLFVERCPMNGRFSTYEIQNILGCPSPQATRDLLGSLVDRGLLDCHPGDGVNRWTLTTCGEEQVSAN